MTRLLVHVEGQTEETFVNEVLRHHLGNFGFESVSARLVGNARLRANRGGVRSWSSVRKDVIRHLREDGGSHATTMVDYYGLPSTGPKAWPGRLRAKTLPPQEKAACVEAAVAADVLDRMGRQRDASRFLPFVTMHEFEGLLFSDCQTFGEAIARPDLVDEFKNIRRQFATPEDINDSPTTAPSKRVENLYPGYEKPLHGIIAILEIGLPRIRQKCPHFDRWVSQLERSGRS
jgi:hypothetical protein